MTSRAVLPHRWFEPLLALALAGAVVLELVSEDLLHRPGQALLAAACALPLAFRFDAPLLALALSGAAGAALETQIDDGGQPFGPVVCLLLALYAVGSRCDGWRLLAGGALGAAALAASFVIREGATDDLLLAAVLPVIGLLIGRAAGVLQLETEVLEQEREAYTRAAIQDERSRIARERHDVIGHSISIMGLQAGAVRSVLPADRTAEREALLAVERTGREAVGEMHRLIGLLRPEAALGGGAQPPNPSLARVGALADDMRAAGMALELTVEGDVAALPAGVDLAGYRIVQEALTNALKHAPGAAVRARVGLARGVLEVEVVDDGDGAPGGTDGHVGHGLLGMRERAVLYGGDVSAAPRPGGGGFRVHARLPVEAA